MLLSLIVDAGCYLGLCLRPSPTLAAENLFLRKQLALYQKRQVKPRRATNATQIALAWPVVRLATRFRHCETQDVHRVASTGLSPVLALEI